MKKLSSLFIASLLVLSLSGCEASEQIKATFSTIVDEIDEAYENVTTKITETKDWINEKVEQTQETVENVQEAAEEVGEAVDSLQELTGGGEEEETSEETEADPETSDETIE